nr:hypothetical protein [Tanacetum cinerariifolium]
SSPGRGTDDAGRPGQIRIRPPPDHAGSLGPGSAVTVRDELLYLRDRLVGKARGAASHSPALSENATALPTLDGWKGLRRVKARVRHSAVPSSSIVTNTLCLAGTVSRVESGLYEANERADSLDFKPVKRRKKPAGRLGTHLPLSTLAQYFQVLPPQRQQLFLGAIVQKGIELPVFWTDAALPTSDSIPFSRLDCYRKWFLDQGYADLFEHLRRQLAGLGCS